MVSTHKVGSSNLSGGANIKVSTMRVLITGHTRGIGKSLADQFTIHGHTVVGFSYTNGFDITDRDVRDKILTEAENCDVFVNNAYAPLAQHLLLEMACKLYLNTRKTIIHVGSKVIDEKIEDVTKLGANRLVYYHDKLRSHEYIRNNFAGSRAPYILNVIPGYVDTLLVSKSTMKKIDPDKLAKLVYDLFSDRDNFFVEEVKVISS